MVIGELKDVKLFVFVDKLVFESELSKGTSKISLQFDIVLRLNYVHIRGLLILHVVHIAGIRMIESVVDGLYRENNLIGIMRGLNPLQFLPFDQGVM